MSDNYRSMAKCTCGSVLIYSYTEEHGNVWVHWRPTEEALNYDGSHMMVEGSTFTIEEKDFEYWNDKTDQDLRDSVSSITTFWRDIDETD